MESGIEAAELKKTRVVEIDHGNARRRKHHCSRKQKIYSCEKGITPRRQAALFVSQYDLHLFRLEGNYDVTI